MSDNDSSFLVEFEADSFDFDDTKKFTFPLNDNETLEKAKASAPGVHTLSAKLNVSPSPGSAPRCVTRKKVHFYTDLMTQALNVTLNLHHSLQGKVQILKATCDQGDIEKCLRVEYWNTTASRSKAGNVLFGQDCPAGTDMVRLIFKIARRTSPFNFDIHIRVNDSLISIIDIPCDPQAGNDPPKIDPPPLPSG